jgi:hypothetical protein
MIYNGSVRNTVLVMAISGLATTGIYLLKPWICLDPIVHHPDELARD